MVDDSTEMSLKGQAVLRIRTVQQYAIKKDYSDKRTLCIIDSKDILKRQVSPIYIPLAKTVSFLSYPLEHLELGLNPDGAIAKIVNQEEISERWQELKQTDEAQVLLADQAIGKDVEHAMDADYSQSLRIVNETLKYRLLCPDFFGRYTLAEKHIRETDLQLTSNFFTSDKIRFTLEEECNCILEENTFIIRRKYQSMDEMQKELSAAYRGALEDYLQCPLDYQMTIDCTFTFSYSSFRMQETVCIMREQLNDEAVYSNEIRIRYNNEKP